MYIVRHNCTLIDYLIFICTGKPKKMHVTHLTAILALSRHRLYVSEACLCNEVLVKRKGLTCVSPMHYLGQAELWGSVSRYPLVP